MMTLEEATKKEIEGIALEGGIWGLGVNYRARYGAPEGNPEVFDGSLERMDIGIIIPPIKYLGVKSKMEELGKRTRCLIGVFVPEIGSIYSHNEAESIYVYATKDGIVRVEDCRRDIEQSQVVLQGFGSKGLTNLVRVLDLPKPRDLCPSLWRPIP